MKKRKKCEYCDSKFVGYTEKQIDTLYSIHLITQHKDKVIIKKK